MLRCFAWLPREIELPQAVQHNANGDVVIISVKNGCGQTVQVVVQNDEYGDMTVGLRGWGNEPAALGNRDKTSFRATLTREARNTCERCYHRLEDCECTSSTP